tara:strand:- start:614 stop:814 length:201 start_codon:yes stop_codon:yes gene_type:complete
MRSPQYEKEALREEALREEALKMEALKKEALESTSRQSTSRQWWRVNVCKWERGVQMCKRVRRRVV